MVILRKWWGKGLIAAALGLVVLAALAPTLIGNSPLLNVVARSAAADLDGQVTIGSASLGWFSPVVLENVVVADPEGRQLLSVAQVESSRTLLDLLRDTADLGKFRVSGLLLAVHCTEQQSNLETVLAKLLAPKDGAPAKARPAVELELVQGQVTIDDAPTKQHWRLDGLNATLALPADPTAPVRLVVEGRLGERPVKADLTAELGDVMKGTLTVQADAVPLALVGAVVRRFDPSAQLSGTLAARIAASWDGNATDKLTVDGLVSARQVALSSRLLGKDRLALQSVEMPCQLRVRGRELHFAKVQLTSELAQAALTGKVTLTDDLLSSLAAPGWQMTGSVDLGKLAAALPNTLALDGDGRITAGQLALTAASAPTERGVAWNASVRSLGLSAIQQGQPVSLPGPVTVQIAGHQDAGGPAVLDRMHCDAGFLALDAEGPLERLAVTGRADLARLTHAVPLPGVRLAGKLELATLLRLTPDALQADAIRVLVRDFQAQAPGLAVNEPALELTTALHGSLHTATVLLTETRLRCAAVTVAVPRLALVPAVGLQDLSVRGAVEGDLGRLQRWLAAPAPAVQGSLKGAFGVQNAADGLRWDVDLQGQQVVVGPLTAPTWREPVVKLVGRGAVRPKQDQLTVADARLQADAVTLTLQGDVSRLSSTCELALSGQLQYDLAKLAPQMRACLGLDVKVAGKGSRPCSLSGPLAAVSAKMPADPLARLQGGAGLGWDAAEAYGCLVGPGEVQAQLGGGWVRCQPIQSTLNQGKLTLQPALRLTPGPMELQLPAGRILERAQITPAMCASMLGLALPALSNVAEVEGQVSADLDASRAPLDDWTRADASGRLTLQGVRLGSSPLIRELGVLLRSPAIGCQIRDSVVPVALKDGRIHHRDLQLVFSEMTIRTQGSVGLDGSLALTAELPMPPKWVGADRLGTALAQQTIQIPIGGTLTHPRIDPDELRKLSARVLRDTAKESLRREVQDGFRRLLPGQK